jgi:hypothetical protein
MAKKSSAKTSTKKTEPALDAIIGRAIRDDQFRDMFLDNPLKAAEVSGFKLNMADRIALKTIDKFSARSFLDQFIRDPGTVMWCTDKTCYEFESSLSDKLNPVVNPAKAIGAKTGGR